MSSRLPPWEELKHAAAKHVDPAPQTSQRRSTKHGIEHIAYRLECNCGHVTVWSARQEDAVSKWLNHLALVGGLERPTDHQKVTPRSHPRGR